MNTGNQTPETLMDAVKYFAVYENAHNFMVQVRWAGGQVCCPSCGSVRVRYIQTRRQWECREQHAKKRFSLKTGTIMEDSPLPLEKWLVALWMEVSCKNSISSWEIHRALGITQKSAWFVLHRIRVALKSGSLEKMGGKDKIIEADETFIGGLAKNMHRKRRERVIQGRGYDAKTAVLGILERGGKIRTKVFGTLSGRAVKAEIREQVAPGSKLHTDAWKTYRGLHPEYVHQFVDHSVQYVRDNVHTNGLENFWSLFKRCIKGTHISIYASHLQSYVDSEVFRFNHRKLTDGERFLIGLSGVQGKRLTYQSLITLGLEGYTGSSN